MTDFGIMFRRQKPPEELMDYASVVEDAGFDEIWLVEDCFYAGGLTSAAVVLTHTEQIKIGLGIMPAVARNPAFTAMEIATLARSFPGRFLPGIGHGVGAWMKQIGAFPGSQLTALEEVTQSTRALLRGEKVNLHGQHVHLDGVELDFPPVEVPPVQLGVRGPKSLQVSGRSADGTILAEGTAPGYIRWAREQIKIGQDQAGRNDHHRLTVYVWTSIGGQKEEARMIIRPEVARTLAHVGMQLEPIGLKDEVDRLINEYGEEDLANSIPDDWLDILSVSGSVQDCADSVQRFIEAGVDALVFVPPLMDEREQISRMAKSLLPLFRP